MPSAIAICLMGNEEYTQKFYKCNEDSQAILEMSYAFLMSGRNLFDCDVIRLPVLFPSLCERPLDGCFLLYRKK